jgi:holo-[acyl-carrier protein] synthase
MNPIDAALPVTHIPSSEIVGVGIDCEACPRFLELNETELARIYSSRERDHEKGSVRHHEHLAGKFAAKEAVIKALSAIAPLEPASIEILNDPRGRPFVVLPPELGLHYGVLVSVSHTSDIAMACALAFKK